MRRNHSAGNADVRLGGSFVVAQIALAVTMVAGAGLLVRSLGALATLDPGFDAARVIQVSVNPESRGFGGGRLTEYYRDLTTRFEALPGVESVSFSQVGLLSTSRTTGTLDVPGFNGSTSGGCRSFRSGRDSSRPTACRRCPAATSPKHT